MKNNTYKLITETPIPNNILVIVTDGDRFVVCDHTLQIQGVQPFSMYGQKDGINIYGVDLELSFTPTHWREITFLK